MTHKMTEFISLYRDKNSETFNLFAQKNRNGGVTWKHVSLF